MKKLSYVRIMIVFALLAVGLGAHAQVLDSCDQWANYCSGDFCVYNNLWGENAGPQCITAQSTTRFTVRSTQSGGGVKTYPNSSREMGGENITVGSLSSCTSYMSVSTPGTGDYCTAWDIWCPEEVMIWMNTYGNVSPWGSYVETVTLGGVTWDVYKNGYPGFVRSNTNSMTVDIKSILDYCVGKGWLHNDGVIEKIQGGFEITSTGGVERTFTMNSYSVSFQTGGSGTTPNPTTAPTATPTPVSTPVPTPSPSAPPSVGPGNGNGLLGEYFDDTTLSSRVLSRVDSVIDFNWGGGSPDSSLPSDQFSVRWTGRIEARMTETYTITARMDDGVRVWINNQQIIDDWSDHEARDASGTYYMQMGSQYDIRVEYYESGGDASAQLYWENPYLSREIIPQSQLYSEGAPTGNLGDVNEDGTIDIVDALLIAQEYVGLNPSNFNAGNADTNCDGNIDIVDALLIAQFYVGLINEFC